MQDKKVLYDQIECGFCQVPDVKSCQELSCKETPAFFSSPCMLSEFEDEDIPDHCDGA